MKNLPIKSFLFCLSLISTTPSFAYVEAIVSVKNSANFNLASYQQLLNHSDVMSHRAVFSQKEIAGLQKMKLDYLGRAEILKFRSLKIYNRFKKTLKDYRYPVTLDRRTVDMAALSVASSTGLQAKQWALHNDGSPQTLDLDPMTNYVVPGRAGEDIGIQGLSFNQGPKTLVAVIDTGIQKDHPALQGAIHRNEIECPMYEQYVACINGKNSDDCSSKFFDPARKDLDQNGNGYPMDCEGWSILGGLNGLNIVGKPDFDDNVGHGTHVSGVIAAHQVNGLGTVGVTQNAEILPVQVIDAAPTGVLKPMSLQKGPDESQLPHPKAMTFLSDMVARAMLYAMANGAKVINFSMGWPQAQDGDFMRQVIQEAQSQGILIVAASGNDSTRALLRPCAYPGVICVAASGPDGAIASYSNYGSGVDIVAPGTNILSTYPQSLRSINLRETNGYEFLSGTSQATPFITGLLAELISRGMSSSEAYARLILGARPSRSPLDVQGTSDMPGSGLSNNPLKSPVDQNKYTLSGNVDLKRALSVVPQALVIPASKEHTEIKWDRQSNVLTWNFALRNAWMDFDASKFSIQAQIAKPNAQAVRPHVASLTMNPSAGIWKSGELRNVQVVLQIDDAPADKTRIPSELDLIVTVKTENNQRSFILQADVLTELSPTTNWQSIENLSINNMPKTRTQFLPVLRTLDNDSRRDYALSSYDSKQWEYYIMSQAGPHADYNVQGSFKIPAIKDNADLIREYVVRFREQTATRYVLSIYDDNNFNDTPSASPIHFFVLDDKFNLLETVDYDSIKSQVPFPRSLKWMKMNGHIRPLWIGPGMDTTKIRNRWDIWQDPDNQSERPKNRLYYIDDKNQINGIEEFNKFKIVDVLESSVDQNSKGTLPLLLARNRGSEVAPSYLYDFAVAEFQNGKIENFRPLNLFSNDSQYVNLLDTRTDELLSLDYEPNAFNGTYWFAGGQKGTQKISFLLSDNVSFKSYDLSAVRSTVDAALFVRSAYFGKKLSGAYVLTNSEIQYHDLNSQQVANKSMERYSFFADDLSTNLQFPITVDDLSLVTKLPALFTTETSGLTQGVRVVLPRYQGNKLIELTAPARLRIKAAPGCRPTDDPVWGGAESAAALDYYCADATSTKIKRFRLDF